VIYVVGLNQEIQSPGSAGSLLIMYLMFAWAMDWVYWKLISIALVCWSMWKTK
jgi:hypothetical protein